jgi:membrane fusion protein, copper/silver efflux system
MNRRWASPRAQAAAIGFVAATLALVVVLVIQHQQHGWPFVLHHDAGSAPQSSLAEGALRTAGHGDDAHGRADVELDPAGIAAAGLAVEAARVETMARTVRTIANVVPDERRISHVHTRVPGWIEELHVGTTGENVRAGQPLATLFSQDLFASQTEYLAALAQGAGPRSAVAQGARARLGVLGMTEAEIREIERTGEPRRLVTVTAPFAGTVLRRGVSVGTAVDPSTQLFTMADLSVVWVLAEVAEADSAAIHVGMPAVLEFEGTGVGQLETEVDFLYPTLSERTRTLRVRLVVPNPDALLRPGMYGSAMFRTASRPALTVPRDAVVETSDMQHIFVAVGAGRFEPRPVRVGLRMGDRVEIIDGLEPGDAVVIAGVFLLDSESRLRAVGGVGGGHAGHGAPADARDAPEPPQHRGH